MLTTSEISERRHAARRREIVDRILPVVEQLLNRGEGYSNLTVEDILSRSSLSRSTFYRYFKDKNELLLALSEPALEDIRASALRPFELGPNATRRELQAELRRTIETYRPHIALMNAMVEVSAYDTAVGEQFSRGFAAVRESITEHIAEGQRAGFIRSDLLPEETAGWLTWMAERGMNQLVPDGNAERLAESIATILWYTAYEGQGRSEG